MSILTGRIIKGVGGLYEVVTEHDSYRCTPRGILRKRNQVPLVGDIVNINVSEGRGVIDEITPRTNELIRPRVANIDRAILVMSVCTPDFDLYMLERYILLCEKSHVVPIICINKWDLDVPQKDEIDTSLQVYREIGYTVVCVSAEQDHGIDALREAIAGKVTAMVGMSGVGKSSITNRLARREVMETGLLSERLRRGKHTTKHTELIDIGDAFIMDTPGFSSTDITHITKQELGYLYKDFVPYLGSCRFSDCMHLKEIGCAVKDRLGSDIHPFRYRSYERFFEELEQC